MKFPYCQHRHSHPNPEAPALEIQKLGVSYSSEGKFALKDFDISVPSGWAVALVGPNGAGKSTYLKPFAVFCRPVLALFVSLAIL